MADSATRDRALASTEMIERKLNDSTEVFDSGFLSDCVVKCGDKEWKLHKLLLCSRSKFFKAALTGNFKESATNEVVLHEQHPEIVEKTLRFLSSGDLLAQIPNMKPIPVDHGGVFVLTRLDSCLINALTTCISVYILADFLGFERGLLQETIAQLHNFIVGMVRTIQQENKTWTPDEKFMEAFTESAKLAYGVPGVQHIPLEFPAKTLRGPFVEFLLLTDFSFIRNRSFLQSLETEVPELVLDAVREMGLGGFQLEVHEGWVVCEGSGVDAYVTCADCVRGPHVSDNSGMENAWVRLREDNILCFKCWAKHKY
ncbi:hypothetical protein B0T16DRAFT_455389 [Cercophora newfieldiana]|uniref:BTB domain-containing protein n=1 Tax=Cercophora newfieldiana TaxID=92897 RepID=A0AA39YJD3_9PEZI|nr:hypothetical protein B0T16DRAFT_455389 [Cercophora newfieldiana]